MTRYPLPSLGPEEGVRLWRDHDGAARANIRHRLKLRSEDGFDFGTNNEGAVDLATNILIDFGLSESEAVAFHRPFLKRFLLRLPHEGGEIQAEDIHEWLELRLMGEEETEDEVEMESTEQWSEENLTDWAHFYSENEDFFAPRGVEAFGGSFGDNAFE